MKLRELKAMNDLGVDELRARERELTEELFHLRLRRTTSQLPNAMKMRSTRRTLARVKTLLRQRTPVGGATQ
jgi:large subunit ribosomal protein L29